MKYSSENAFLVFIIAWFLLLVTAFIGYIIYLMRCNKDAKSLIYILGCWWIGLGIGVYLAFGKADNLMLDSSKGLVLVLLNYFNKDNFLTHRNIGS
jgi:L-asparagine transporter-like permease